ncbi:MAG TPA: lysylphosphatidylglycerol synthase transmembrane domain-containing protein [Bacteroidales bacterium]|nr:lysylphosphatidylglycerol synthase transmembrane domain-containing protein [Bacteroidales bacterium]
MAFFFSEDTPVRKKIFTFLKFLFFLGLGITIIWLSLKNLTPSERGQILHSFRIAQYNWVVLAIVLGIFSHILRSLRWRIFLEPMGYQPSVKNTFYAVMIGYFANLAFPRLGEVTRCGILARYEKIPFQKSFGTVITERAIDMMMFFLLFVVMILTQIGTIRNYLDTKVYPQIMGKFSNPASYRLLLLAILGVLLILVTAFILLRKQIAHTRIYQQIRNIVLGFWEGLKSLGQIRKPVWFVLYTLSIWLLYFLMLYVCFFCFEGTSFLSVGAGLSALVLGSIGIMITPGGIGLYPAIVQETLLLYGVLKPTGLALGWIAWTAQTAMILVVGGIALLLLTFNKQADGNA